MSVLAASSTLDVSLGAWASGFSAHFRGNEAEQSGYLGVPTLLILGLFLNAVLPGLSLPWT